MTTDTLAKLAHEIWSAAQLAPGEGIEDGIARIESALTAQALPAAGRCDECGKDQAEGWALYCVGCLEKTGLLAKEALPSAQHVSSTAADLTGPNNTTAQATTGAATTGAPSEPFGYFKAEPFGWTDCAEDDDGAVALYEGPQQAAQAPALTDHEIETLAHRMCWRYKHDGDSYGDPAYTFNKVTLIDFVRRVGAGSVSGWPALLAGAALQQSVATMESAAAHLGSLPKMHQGKLLAHDLRRAASCCETAIESIQQATQPQAARTTEGI